eukprot:TRINITY_DN6183_c0_g1_i1.p1 TRINITY_DN6183_c0_g1~~TRINITY_DN6183_c0_g1_i1.p1  ORF type:complete len:302 (+),score=63.67 TRINITY_DN6183_c0_g1_i1:118-906(+)
MSEIAAVVDVTISGMVGDGLEKIFCKHAEKFKEFGCETQTQLYQLCGADAYSLFSLLEAFGYNVEEIDKMVISLQNSFTPHPEVVSAPAAASVGASAGVSAGASVRPLVQLEARAEVPPPLEHVNTELTTADWLLTLDATGEFSAHLGKLETFELNPSQLATLMQESPGSVKEILGSVGFNTEQVRIMVGSLTPTASKPTEPEVPEPEVKDPDESPSKDVTIDTSQFHTIRQWLVSLDNGVGKYLKFADRLEILRGGRKLIY